MATVSFFLKEPNAQRETPIIARLAHAGTKTKVYTGESILPGCWVQSSQESNPRKLKERATTLNLRLAGIKQTLLDYHAQHRAAGTLPTAEQLRQSIELQAAPEPEPAAELDLIGAFGQWIESRRLGKTENTLRTNLTARRHLKDFDEKTGYPVRFDTITPAFAERFTNYLLGTVKLGDAAVRKNIYIIKNFLTWAGDNGYPVTEDFKRFRYANRDPDVLALTAGELAALAGLDLSARPALDNARALFLLACYTGLRFSDVAGLKPENVRDGYLLLTTQKTRETLPVPLRPEARPLVGRLLAGTLRPLPNQKLNGHLKTLAQLAGIDTPTEKTRYAGQQRQTKTLPKWAFVTSHTARKTFVTLALEDGLRPDVVMKITGHKDLKSFRRYVHVAQNTVLRDFAAVYGGGEEK